MTLSPTMRLEREMFGQVEVNPEGFLTTGRRSPSAEDELLSARV